MFSARVIYTVNALHTDVNNKPGPNMLTSMEFLCFLNMANLMTAARQATRSSARVVGGSTGT